MKSKLLRVLAISCAISMMAAVSGCGSTKSDQQASNTSTASTQSQQTQSSEQTGKKDFSNKELEVAAFEGGYGKAYFEAAIEKFETEYPGVKVTLTSSPKIDEIIKPRIVAGNPPDVLCGFGDGRIQQLVSEGAIADITDIFNENAPGKDVPLKDTIFDGLIDGVCKPLNDGKIYLAPTEAGAQGLYYNKTLFESKGWKVPKTWDEFFALGDIAKKDGIALFTYQGLYPSYNEMVIMPSIASTAGMDALNNILNYKEGAWKDSNVRKVLEVYEKIAKGGYLMKGTVAMNHTQAQAEFLKGKALFIPNGSWFENEMKDAIPETGFTFGFTPAPVFNQGDQQYIYSGCGYNAVTAKAKNPELAKEFIKFLYRDDMIKLLAEKNTAVMPVKGAVEMVKDIVPESVYNTFKAFDNAKALSLKWKSTPTTTVKISDEIYKPISSLMSNQLTVDQWIDRIEKADATLNDEIAKAGK